MYALDSQFQATELWNAVVSHLKANVKTKPKKAHQHCFNGADAVETVWQQLQIMKDHIPKEVTREKALRVWLVIVLFHCSFCCN
jgi:hypothetical protein